MFRRANGVLLTLRLFGIALCSVMVFGNGPARASDESDFASIVIEGQNLSLPLSERTLFEFESAVGNKVIWLGPAFPASKANTKNQVTRAVAEGQRLDSASFVFQSACDDGILISPLCQHARNSMDEEYTVYDVLVRPFNERIRSLTRTAGGVFDAPQVLEDGSKIRVIRFEGDTLRSFGKGSDAVYYNVELNGTIIVIIRAFLRQNPDSKKPVVRALLEAHANDIILFMTRRRGQ